ncbi:MAG TPA: DinB family protein [Candidatus Limnocylindrales bacterium]|nr:DinB family protein [Candidatus Limnocylindrales bacterium]
MTDDTALAERIRSAAADLDALEPAVLAAGPWPLATRFDHSDEAAWGPREILAHVDEMFPYWLGEAARILDAEPDAGPNAGPPAFGRVATDDVRSAILGRDRTLPLPELFDRARWEARRVVALIDALAPADLARRGLHPIRGEVSVAELLDRFVASHLAEHVAQLQAVLDGTGPGRPA